MPPEVLDQRLHGNAGLRHHPVDTRRGDVGRIELLQQRHLLLIAAEHVGQPVGHVVGVDIASVGIAQYRLGAVVAGHDDKSVAVGGVENVIGRLGRRRLTVCGQCVTALDCQVKLVLV